MLKQTNSPGEALVFRYRLLAEILAQVPDQLLVVLERGEHVHEAERLDAEALALHQLVQEQLLQFPDEQLSQLPDRLLVRMQSLKDVEDDSVLPVLLHPGLRL